MRKIPLLLLLLALPAAADKNCLSGTEHCSSGDPVRSKLAQAIQLTEVREAWHNGSVSFPFGVETQDVDVNSIIRIQITKDLLLQAPFQDAALLQGVESLKQASESLAASISEAKKFTDKLGEKRPAALKEDELKELYAIARADDASLGKMLDLMIAYKSSLALSEKPAYREHAKNLAERLNAAISGGRAALGVVLVDELRWTIGQLSARVALDLTATHVQPGTKDGKPQHLPHYDTLPIGVPISVDKNDRSAPQDKVEAAKVVEAQKKVINVSRASMEPVRRVLADQSDKLRAACDKLNAAAHKDQKASPPCSLTNELSKIPDPATQPLAALDRIVSLASQGLAETAKKASGPEIQTATAQGKQMSQAVDDARAAFTEAQALQKISDQVKTAATLAGQPLASSVPVPLQEAQDTYLDLRSISPRAENDIVVLRASLYRVENAPGSSGQVERKEQLAEAEQVLRILYFGWFARTSFGVVYTSPWDKLKGQDSRTRAFAPMVASLWTRRCWLGCETPLHSLPRWESFGIGLHVISPDLNQDNQLELGLGVTVSFFHDYLQLGGGVDLSLKEKPRYVFLGTRLFEIARGLGIKAIPAPPAPTSPKQ